MNQIEQIHSDELNNNVIEYYPIKQYIEELSRRMVLVVPNESDVLRMSLRISEDVLSCVAPDTNKMDFGAELKIRYGRRRWTEVKISANDGAPQELTEESTPQEAISYFAYRKAQLLFLERNYSDIAAFRGFQGEKWSHWLDSQLNFIKQNGYWEGGYDPNIRKELVVGAAAFAAVIVSCVGGVSVGEIPTGSPSAAPASPIETPTQPVAPDYWSETALTTSEALAAWQTIPATANEFGVPFLRVDTNLIHFPDGSVRLFQQDGRKNAQYALGFTQFISLDGQFTGFSPTIFYGNDATSVAMLGAPIQIDSDTREWKVIRMENQEAKLDPSFTVIFQKVADGFTMTIKQENGRKILLVSGENSQEVESMPNPTATTVPESDYNIVFQGPEMKFVGDGFPISYDVKARAAHQEQWKATVEDLAIFPMRMITDVSLSSIPQGKINKVYAHFLFENPNRNKENAETALSTALAYTAFMNWKDDDSARANATFHDYLALLVDANKTGDHSQVMFTIRANNMNTGVYDPQDISGVDPFDPTLVFINPNTTDAQANMQLLTDTRGQKTEMVGVGVLETTDKSGVKVKKVFYFVQTPRYGSGARNHWAATMDLLDALSRTFNRKNYDSYTPDSGPGNQFGHVEQDPFLTSVLIYPNGPQSYQVAVLFDPIEGK